MVTIWTASIIMGLLIGQAVFGDGTAAYALAAVLAWLFKSLIQLVLLKLEDRFLPARFDQTQPPAAVDDSNEQGKPAKRRRMRRRN